MGNSSPVCPLLMVAAVCWGVCGQAAAAPAEHVVINEIMASNSSGLTDEDGETSDWIELHNPTGAPLLLGGLALTDRPGDPRWALPDMVLSAGGFRVIFASGNDRSDPAGELHTNFKLGAGGEYLALVDGDGAPVHAFAPGFPPQSPDVSYGLVGADVGLPVFMRNPTAGAANDTEAIFPAAVEISVPAMVFTEPFTVALATATPGAVVRYTVDGSLPGTTHGTVYDGVPLAVSESVLLRAVAVDGGQLSPVGEAAYVRLGAGVGGFESGLPVVVLENFGAGEVPDSGHSRDGSGIVQVARQAQQALVFEPAGDGPARVGGEPAWTARAGVRVRGGISRNLPKNSYSFEAWDSADEDTAIEPFGMPAESDWVLYAPNPKSNFDTTLMYNTFLYDLSRSIGRYAARVQFVELFLHTGGGALTMSDYRGVYVFMEKVKRDAGRVSFDALSADGTEGGWMLGINRMDPVPVGGVGTPQHFHTAGADRVLETPPNAPGAGDDEPRDSLLHRAFMNFGSPGGYEINPVQRAAVEGWFVPFEDRLWGDDFTDLRLGYRPFLDVGSFVDYFLLHNLTANTDGLILSYWIYRSGPGARLRMGPVWDYDFAYQLAPGSSLLTNANRVWYARLRQDPDFLQRYSDRWHELRQGPLSDGTMLALVDAQAAQIADAVAREGVPNWASKVATWKAWLTARAAAIDNYLLVPPTADHPGGAMAPGTVVTLEAPVGDLFYTLDGTDPRVSGGEEALGAVMASGTLTVAGNTALMARARHDGRWSAPLEVGYVVAAVPPGAGDLVLSEIHYHPAGADDAGAEFVEVANYGPVAVSMDDVVLSGGIDFAFGDSPVEFLAPGDRVVVVRDRDAFEQVYGMAAARVAGTFSAGSLSNGGEELELWSGPGLLVAVDYGDAAPWPASADGGGPSLVLASTPGDQPLGPAVTATGYRASVAPDGTPGGTDFVGLAAWLAAAGLADPHSDGDGDGMSAFGEYCLGGMPDSPTGWDLRVTGGGRGPLLVEVPKGPGTDDVFVVFERSGSAGAWLPVNAQLVERVPTEGGAELLRYAIFLGAADAGFVRARYVLVP